MLANLPPPTAIEAHLHSHGYTTDEDEAKRFMGFWGGLKLKEREALWPNLLSLAEDSNGSMLTKLVRGNLVSRIQSFPNLYVMHAFGDATAAGIGNIVFVRSPEIPFLILAWYRNENQQMAKVVPQPGSENYKFVETKYQQFLRLMNP